MPDRFDCISTNLLSRRNVITGSAGALLAIVGSSTFLADADQANSPSPTDNATRTFLHQEIDLKTTPARLYAVLLDSKQFSAFSHLPADIQSEPGGAFSMFGARILGRNVELVPNQRIVQAWRSAGWDPGVYSIVRFEFKEESTQTRAFSITPVFLRGITTIFFPAGNPTIGTPSNSSSHSLYYRSLS